MQEQQTRPLFLIIGIFVGFCTGWALWLVFTGTYGDVQQLHGYAPALRWPLTWILMILGGLTGWKAAKS